MRCFTILGSLKERIPSVPNFMKSAQLIIAATNEAALSIAHAADSAAALAAHTDSLLVLVKGLRIKPDRPC
jgi:hypothetical protein